MHLFICEGSCSVANAVPVLTRFRDLQVICDGPWAWLGTQCTGTHGFTRPLALAHEHRKSNLSYVSHHYS
jgi:hypothetical protein